ncbi:tail fiber protein [Flagellimonas pacifica]|uniref:Uncharacterized protein n=1 Tax=Flagellimonas pacifica TaxID=1247520 RepID=A0A285MR97_9FLAO|nr:tail fiber protein [Allomuricauda parva]SNY99685.1 hypothetical protein SAMN06265377_1496 [Allomuricauda parva]
MKIKILPLLLFTTLAVNAQVHESANGDVGIGTTTPETKIHVLKDNVGVKSTYSDFVLEAIDSQIDIISNSSGTWGSALNLIEGNTSSNTDVWSIARQTTSGNGDSSLQFNFGNANRHDNPNKVTFTSSGKVGIGTTAPDEMLKVNGTASISGNIGVSSGSHWITGNHTLELQNSDAGDVVLSFHRAGHTNAAIKHSALGGLIFSGSGAYDANHAYLKSNGYFGIGTTNPDSKLTVKGNIHAEEVKVDLSVPAPDYVFKEDYNLRSLEEVQNYIKEFGHLPNIPSAKTMEANGIQLGEMNMKLLEKIEELTLYTLEQERKIEKLEISNKRIAFLEKTVEKLLKDKE